MKQAPVEGARIVHKPAELGKGVFMNPFNHAREDTPLTRAPGLPDVHPPDGDR